MGVSGVCMSSNRVAVAILGLYACYSLEKERGSYCHLSMCV